MTVEPTISTRLADQCICVAVPHAPELQTDATIPRVDVGAGGPNSALLAFVPSTLLSEPYPSLPSCSVVVSSAIPKFTTS